MTATGQLATGAGKPVLRCLVVDNQPATLDQLARMLRAQPSVSKVSTAADSTGALRMLHGIDADVAFIEARMPGIDGVELAWLLKRFRAAPRGRVRHGPPSTRVRGVRPRCGRLPQQAVVRLRFITAVRVADTGALTVVVNGQQLPVSRRMAPALRGQLRNASRRIKTGA